MCSFVYKFWGIDFTYDNFPTVHKFVLLIPNPAHALPFQAVNIWSYFSFIRQFGNQSCKVLFGIKKYSMMKSSSLNFFFIESGKWSVSIVLHHLHFLKHFKCLNIHEVTYGQSQLLHLHSPKLLFFFTWVLAALLVDGLFYSSSTKSPEPIPFPGGAFHFFLDFFWVLLLRQQRSSLFLQMCSIQVSLTKVVSTPFCGNRSSTLSLFNGYIPAFLKPDTILIELSAYRASISCLGSLGKTYLGMFDRVLPLSNSFELVRNLRHISVRSRRHWEVEWDGCS